MSDESRNNQFVFFLAWLGEAWDSGLAAPVPAFSKLDWLPGKREELLSPSKMVVCVQFTFNCSSSRCQIRSSYFFQWAWQDKMRLCILRETGGQSSSVKGCTQTPCQLLHSIEISKWKLRETAFSSRIWQACLFFSLPTLSDTKEISIEGKEPGCSDVNDRLQHRRAPRYVDTTFVKRLHKQAVTGRIPPIEILGVNDVF